MIYIALSLALLDITQAISYASMPLLPWRPNPSEVEDRQLQSVPYNSLTGSDQPKDLWDRSHRLLREDKSNRQLLVAYERILVSELNQGTLPVTSVDWGSRDQRKQVSNLIARKLKLIEESRWRLQLGKKTVEFKAQVDKVVKTVIWAQGFVSSAVSADPHSALAWAGVSLLLPLLLNPASQDKALVDGLDYISTLIARFSVIETTYQQHISTRFTLSGPQKLTELDHSFELQVTKLYSQILAYQARVICQLPRNALVRYGRDVLKVGDWSAMLAEMKTTETNCSAIVDIVNTERVNAAWKEQESLMDRLFLAQKEQYQSLRQMTDQMKKEMRLGYEEQRDWHQTEEETKCLQALCTSVYVDHKNINPDRVSGTCQWFLNNKKFHVWAESDSSELLWVTADPGCGKSVLSKSLVDCELQSTLTLTTVYYFFKDNSPEQRSVTHALCALVHQLCCQNRALLRKAVDTYHKKGDKLTSSFVWMWHLLLELAQHPQSGEIVCVLDGLDECQEEDKKTLISSLNDLYTSRTQNGLEGRLKFLVISRPYYDIEDSFNHETIRLAGEDESEIIKREIDLVIKDKIPRIASRKKLDQKTQAALQDRLLQTENRTYLWLHLTLEGVEKGFGLATPQKMRHFIDKLPRTIYQAYETMLLRCPEQEQARKLLHTVLAAMRPLTLREMNMAFNIKKGQKSHEEVDLWPEELFGTYVKNLCGLLVRVHDSKIFLLHQTVKDFLISRPVTTAAVEHVDSEKQGGVWMHSIELKESHLVLYSSCFDYLSFTPYIEKQNGAGDDDDFFDYKSLENDSHEYDFLEYAVVHWFDHFNFSNGEPKTLMFGVMTVGWTKDSLAGELGGWYTREKYQRIYI